MAVYGYCRASTAKQVGSPETQKDIIREYCRKEGLNFNEEWYVDAATSGKVPIGERPAGRILLAKLKRGDNIVVAKLDRLARSFPNFGRIIETFEKEGITLHVVNIPGGRMDPANPIGRMLMAILSSFADFERSMISIRIQEGLATFRSEGGKTAIAPYGWRKTKIWSKRLNKYISTTEPDPGEQRVLRKMVEMRVAGHPYESISSYLNHTARIRTRKGFWWNSATVYTAVARAYKALAEKETRQSAYDALAPVFTENQPAESMMFEYSDVLEPDEEDLDEENVYVGDD